MNGGSHRFEIFKFTLPALFVLAASLYVVSLPQDKETEIAVPTIASKEYLTLSHGESITQTFQGTGETISGLVLFSPVKHVSRQSIQLSIYNENQSLIATERLLRSEYRDDKTALIVTIRPIPTVAKQPLHMTITSTGKDPIPLYINSESSFTNGALQDHTLAGPDTDLSFSLIHPASTPLGVKQGFMAGLIILLGSILVVALPARQYLTAALLLIIALPLATAGFWFSSDQWGISDWDLFAPMHEGYRKAIIDYGMFPFWNPYTYGGVSGLGDPEFSVLSFSFLLELLFGVYPGFRLSIYASIVLCGLGMLVLSKRLGLSAPAALLPAIAFPLSASVIHRFVEGHIQFFALAWIPWIFWSWYNAYEERRNKQRPRNSHHTLTPRGWVIVCGLFLSLTFYQGGIYILFYILPALTAFFLVAKRPWAAIRTTVGAGLWSFGFSAFKVLPVLAWINEFPDTFYHVSSFSLPYWYDIFLRRHLHGSAVLLNQSGGWHEYGAYIGPVVLILMVLGLSRITKSKIVRILFIGLVVTLTISSSGPLLLPLFDVLPWLPRSNIVRVALFSVFTGVLLAGFGLDILWKHSNRKGRYLVPAVVGLAAIDIMSFAYPLSERAFTVPPVVPPIAQAPYPIAFTADTQSVQVGRSRENRTYAFVLAGYGTTVYRPNTAPPLSVALANSPGNGYIQTTDPEAVVRLASWSPNKVELDVTAKRETTITLNSNYSRAWRVKGSSAPNNGRHLSTTVPAGIHSITFQYRPSGYLIGLVITLCTLLFACTRQSIIGQRHLP